jgi:hypothetical protein
LAQHIMTAGELVQLLRVADPDAAIMIHYVGELGESAYSVTDVVPYYDQYGRENNQVALLTWPVWGSSWKASGETVVDLQVSERYRPMPSAEDRAQ